MSNYAAREPLYMSATMDFFGHQDNARRKTGLLVFYFVAAVVTIIAAIYLVIALGLRYAELDIPWTYDIWNTELFLAVTAVTGLIVAAGTLFKISSLSGPAGGERVATMLGGRPIDTNTDDPDERKLLNVVEEMAIASGTPVPPVYLVEDDSINAFAAGYTPSDAVVGVTRGAMRILSRDELQGVIAHEFSHILNGDMRLNIRLMGVLHGILALVVIGTFLLRILGSSRSSRRSSSSKKDSGGGAILFIILLVGLTFTIVGWIGEFFANLIKMAVSRQREYLADASAVQFTRNPGGIGSALKKIGGYGTGSRLESAHAKEVSHLFFADGLKRRFSSFFATHPDLATRIQRIEPSWNGEYPSVELPKEPVRAPLAAAAAGAAGVAAAEPVFEVQMQPEKVVESIGSVRPENVVQAATLVASMPELLTATAHEPFGARALVYALLLDPDESIREAQVQRLSEHADAPVFAELQRILPHTGKLTRSQRLPLLEMALPSLRHLSESQYVAFIDNLEFLIQADQDVSVFEFSLRQLVLRQYRVVTGKGKSGKGTYRSLSSVLPDAVALLSALAWYGSDRDETKARAAFDAAMERMEPRKKHVQPVDFGTISVSMIDNALETLRRASPMVKKWAIDACVATIIHDRRITVDEAELIRAIGSAIDCPVPLFAVGELFSSPEELATTSPPTH
ncbi:MAG: M48 family metalloprotease [Chitinivibrionales bacterium]|nr:M48 family metalloprotease [Chitinivibrionales bacterium]